MKFKISVLPGDGTGPEVVEAGIKVLKAIEEKFSLSFDFFYEDIGGISIEKHGIPLTDEALKTCKCSDAVLLGAVGVQNWDPRAKTRPEDGILRLRSELRLFANLRLVKVFSSLKGSSTLKPEVIEGVDFLFVRELTGGLYFGKPKKKWEEKEKKAIDTLYYTEEEIERILRVGFELAKRRRRKLSSIDKANVLESSKLWREIAIEISKEYPNVEIEHILVDTCAMRIIQNPKVFDVLVTENMFGDILTDEASMLSGSIGMLPSASLSNIPLQNKKVFGLYEPIHGSAPDIANKNIANPIATILSCAMMLRYSFSFEEGAKAIEESVENILKKGYRTNDIMEKGAKNVGTTEMVDLIASKLLTHK